LTAVLDASTAVRVTLNPAQEPGLSALLEQAELVLAPQLLAAEVANTYWKYFLTGRLAPAAAEMGLRSSLDLVDEFVPLEPLSAEALELAMAAKHPVYDMFYLVLARRHAAVLLTADKTLAEYARRLGVRLGEPE
jgi:predicted nucleic acid-binding protein